MSTSLTSSSREHAMSQENIRLGVTAVMLPELDFAQQIELCRSLGVGYYQFRPREIGPRHRGEEFSSHGNHRFDLTPQRLLREGRALTRRLHDAGLECWGTLPAIDAGRSDDEIQIHFDGAAAAGAGRINCSPPDYPKAPFDYAEVLERTIERYRHIVDRIARPLGLKVLIETHRGGLASSPCLAWNICRHFSPRDVGVIFDVANFALEGAIEPVLAVLILSAYIDCVHIGGARRVGAARVEEFCAMSESALHLPTWLAELKTAGLNVPLIVEDFRHGMSGEQKLTEGVRFLRDVLTLRPLIVSRSIEQVARATRP